MEPQLRDLEFVKDLCRLDRERELSATADLAASEGLSEARREWVPATDWMVELPKAS